MGSSTFLIIGDSWGCGEWQHHTSGPPKVVHSGLEQYLTDSGHLVQNLSVGGASNSRAISTLKTSDLNQYTAIIWFQTDPLRDIVDYSSFFNVYNSYDKVVAHQKLLLEKTYSELDKLGIKILCVGGCSKLDLDLLGSFSNLIPSIPSVIELLIPNFTHPEIWFSGWYMHVDRQFGIDCIDKFLYNKLLQGQLEKYREVFWPDGLHPNRVGHKKIFERLNENLS